MSLVYILCSAMQLAPKNQDAEVARLKVVLITRGLNFRTLAEKTQLHPRVVQNLLNGHNAWWPPRAAINRTLQEKIFHKRPRAHRQRKPQSPLTQKAHAKVKRTT